MDRSLLDILTCPSCKSELYYRPGMTMLVCKADRLGFPIVDDKPVMLASEAVQLSQQDMAELKDPVA